MLRCAQCPQIFIVAPLSIISIYQPRFWELFLNPLSNGLRISPHLSSRSHAMEFRYPVQLTSPRIFWKAELFDRALLRRTALVASGENPEVFDYKPVIRTLYTVLAALFWPSVPIFLVVVAAIVMRFPRTTTKTRLIAFALSVLVIDVLCRISFYSIVDWILWELPPRYILGANVLTVVIVSTLLTVWLPPAIGSALGPKLTRLPALRFWPKMTGIPAVARELKPPH